MNDQPADLGDQVSEMTSGDPSYWSRSLIGLLLFASCHFVQAQDNHTISGSIKDASTGEDLIGATVVVSGTGVGASANHYGFYSLTLPTGAYTLRYHFIGYEELERKVELVADQRQDIELVQSSLALKEVEVRGKEVDANVRSVGMSVVRMTLDEMKTLPAFMGEVDVIKALQLLPGVQTVGEGGTGLYVRGGNVDQNLILLDEAPVYNAGHLLGFFSVFNGDAIKDVQLYKGGIPAEYGGRLSSVVDIRMKDGNAKRSSAAGGLGTIASRLTIQAPIAKDKGSFIMSGRRTYADLFLKLSNNADVRDDLLYFYDLNLKANYRIGKNDRVFLSGYFGRDVFKTPDFHIRWGNATVTGRWNHIYNERLFSNVTLNYSDFSYALGSQEPSTAFSWNSNIRNLSGKVDYSYYLNSSNSLKFGYQSIQHTFVPGVVKGESDQSVVTGLELQNSRALEHGVYVSNEHSITPRFTASYGLRGSMFQNIGARDVYRYDAEFAVTDTVHYTRGQVYNTYVNLEPRLGLRYALNDLSAMKVSYNRMAQYLHLASNGNNASPFDIWFPSSAQVKPELADQVAAGYFRNFHESRWETSVELYHKAMRNAIDFRDHATLFLNANLEGELRFGKARSYGAEFMVRKREGRCTGLFSYTLSKAERTIPGINHGKTYRAKYDKTHNISITGSYALNDVWRVGALWVYQTGGAATFPVGRFEYGGQIVPVYSERNAARLPAYHRLDFSVTKQSRKNKDRRWKSEWVLSVYNAYLRHNTYSINFVQAFDDPYRTVAEKTYLFSIVPSLTYNFEF